MNAWTNFKLAIARPLVYLGFQISPELWAKFSDVVIDIFIDELAERGLDICESKSAQTERRS